MSSDPAAPRRVLLFGKVPRPGETKTRLAPALGEAGAARLYRAFLDDTVRLARASGADRVELWLAGAGEGDGGPDGLPGDLRLRRQSGEGLGERLRRAFGAVFREGAARAAVLGTDHPTLPPGRLDEAFDALDGADVVLGPTPDGGYYLLALRREAWPGADDLFRRIPWSTPDVAATTRERAREAELALAEIEAWYDVDEPADLERLRRDAAPGSATARALERLGPAGG